MSGNVLVVDARELASFDKACAKDSFTIPNLCNKMNVDEL